MSHVPSICAWCLGDQPPTLTILDGTPAELALLALEANDATSISHGICAEHKAQAQIQHQARLAG